MAVWDKAHSPWCRDAVAGGVLVLACLLAYANSFHCPFQFDDFGSIVKNPTIRSPLSWRVLAPRLGGETASGRPFFNLTLAVNQELHGASVEGYHVGNLLCHALSALVLYALVRGTLALPGIQPWLASRGWGLSLAVALLWVVHPLQTAAVTYLSQRCEVLAGLFYLLTLLCLLRGHLSPRPAPWYVACVAVCLLGMASKEVVVSAPLMALLYDRAFLAGSLRGALRRRGWLYVALFLTWVPLGLFMSMTEGRGGSAGMDTRVSWVSYLLVQPSWILHYLRLSILPQPLVFDYGAIVAPVDAWGVAAAVVISALFLAALAATLWRPRLGFLALGFFAVLAPTSSFVPIATQVAAEHRIYLPLAAILVLLAVSAAWALERWCRPYPRAGWTMTAAVATIAVTFAALTHLRNQDYATNLGLWTDNAAKTPDNPRNWTTIGAIYHESGDAARAIENYQLARGLAPDDPVAHYNIAVLLHEQSQPAEAETSYRKALELNPKHTSAMLNLGGLLMVRGAADEAAGLFEEALRLQPRNPVAHLALGEALATKGEWGLAAEHLGRAVQLAPRLTTAYPPLANVLESEGRQSEAEQMLRKALPVLTASDGPTFTALVRILLRQGKIEEAERLVEQTVSAPTGSLRNHAFHLCNLLNLSPWDHTAAPPIPAPPAGLVELAAFCRKELGFEASAARLYAWAFAADPRLLEHRSRLHRFDAACAALRAGKGLGMDSYRTSKEHRLALVRLGLSWLEGELADLARLARGAPEDRSAARRALLAWARPGTIPGDHEGTVADGLTDQEQSAIGRMRAEAGILLRSLSSESVP